MEETLKLPRKRIAVLIGKNGDTKQRIEKEANALLSVDSKTGEVLVEGKDSEGFYNALNIAKAIGRGFSPKHAMLLLNPGYLLEMIDLDDFVKSSKEMQVKKGRVIGRGGRGRALIEKRTGCFISVYGKTIALIGKTENIGIARNAVEMLLNRASHLAVNRFLERKQLEEHRFEV